MSRSTRRALVLSAGLSLVAISPAFAAGNEERAAQRAELAAAANNTTPAGHDGSAFYLGSDDGAYKLKVGGQIQFRYIANLRDDAPDSEEDLTSGFQTRRTRLEFSGNVINKQITYQVQTDFNRSSGTAVLLDAWVRHALNDNWSLRFGQFKAPLLREELTSGKRLQSVDRTITNAVFAQGRSQGIQIEYDTDRVRLAGALTDGLATLNSDFDASNEADYALTGRAEFRLAGNWKQFADLTSWRGSETGALIGAAIHWQAGGETGNTTDNDILQYTLDAGVEGNGWNIFAAFIGRNTDPAGGSDADDFGFIIQGGVFLTNKTELFAGYDIVIPDSDRASGDDEFSTITVGVNHYFVEKSHAAKFTADLLYFLDAQAESSSLVSRNTGVGLLSDTEDGQVALRFQFQLLF